jgi:hypothetical protein
LSPAIPAYRSGGPVYQIPAQRGVTPRVRAGLQGTQKQSHGQ